MFIALLRGINVGGHNIIPMAELRSLCSDIGWRDVETYIQSGNVIFSSARKRSLLEVELEKGIQEHFRISTQAIVRSAMEWRTLMSENPFPEESERAPNLVMLALAKKPPAPDAATELARHAVNGERVIKVDGALWIHFPHGAGRSKLTPAVLDRLVESPVTTRNWRTVVKLGGMIGE